MNEKLPERTSVDDSRHRRGRWSSSGGGANLDAGHGGLYAHDPRSSSTQSLVPSLSGSGREDTERRKLLIVYIHGFMGNDTSFQSFPAHVHKYLKLALSDTHVIHSKIYPRYKTYKAIEVARDNFSRWLEPHESPTTDVVLCGHSMGGLLSADVVLMPSGDQNQHRYFRHRILGTVNLDAPLLGLHPGIIVAGISSLFRKNEPPKPIGEQTSQAGPSQAPSGVTSPGTSLYSETSTSYSDPSRLSLVSSPSPEQFGLPGRTSTTFDPNFNPAFTNDVQWQDRGWWKNVVHFVKKHNSEGLVDAATHHIMSHLEFGSCLLDINLLKNRYENLRKLEDIDDLKHYGFPHVPPQVRFVQYFTICHGYPKKPKEQESDQNAETQRTQSNASTGALTPRISVQDQDGHPMHSGSLGAVDDSDDERRSLEVLDPAPMPEEDEHAPKCDTADRHLESQDDPKSDDQLPPPYSVCGESTTEAGAGLTSGASPPEEPSCSDAATTAQLTEAVTALDLDLPAIPELPARPDPPDLTQYTDKDARKQAEKEGKRVQKSYDQDVKNRQKAIKERQKIIDKRKKKRAQEAEKREKEEQKRRQKEEAAKTAATNAALQEEATISANAPDTTQAISSSVVDQGEPPRASLDSTVMPPQQRAVDSLDDEQPPAQQQQEKRAKPPKKPKERKFCNLPHKVDGQVDPKWVKIFLKDTDEVGAHTGLFFAGEHYEKLVGDVGDTIVRWVQEDMTKRAIMEME